MNAKIKDLLANATARAGFTLVAIDNKVNSKKHAKRAEENRKFAELMKNYK